METLPAKEFTDRYVSAYGAGWNEVLTMLTGAASCAKYMAEFIDDIEFYGQETPVYVDESGCVEDGNRIVLAKSIIGETIDFVIGPSPEYPAEQIVVVEFDIEAGDIEHFEEHASDYLSFRAERDWVSLLDISLDAEDGAAVMHCPSGQYTADRIEPLFSRRALAAGVQITGVRASMINSLG